MKKPGHKIFDIGQPLAHPDHPRPVTRRQFISQGFAMGAGAIVGSSMLNMLSSKSYAATSDLQTILNEMTASGCPAFDDNNAKIPVICFDLAGGANMAGSNVLVGGQGGQEDFLSTSGYAKQGLPPEMTPNASLTGDNIRRDFGLAFHSDSMFFTGINDKAANAAANTHGGVLAARSENDTGNNPHNPMYALNLAGADGDLLTLIGSRPSDSGGNSMAPLAYMDPKVRPTKIDRASDVVGLVDTGDLAARLGKESATALMESMYRLSNAKLGHVNTTVSGSPISVFDTLAVQNAVRCGYLGAARATNVFSDPLDPELDPDIVGDTGIFTSDEYNGEGEFSDNNNRRAAREFQKTAAVMKLVVNGHAGAGTITMGGYDYHGGGRITGERRDLVAGRCIGACLDYARRVSERRVSNGLRPKPLMIYVFSDGSLSSNGMIDGTDRTTFASGRINDPGGGDKYMWVSDNQQTAASFFLAYNHNGRPTLRRPTNQIGWMRPSGDVETGSWPGANNVNLLVEAVALNFMALNGDLNQFRSRFPNHGLGLNYDQYALFNPIV